VSGLTYETCYTWWVNVTDGIYWTNGTYCFTTEKTAPIISDENPIDGAVDVVLNPVLSIDVVDYQGDSMNVVFQSNASGIWNNIGSNNSVTNGTYSQTTHNMTDYNHTYWWCVNVSDSSGHWTNETFSFTTKPPLEAPYSMFPELGSEMVVLEYNSSCWDASAGGPHTLDIIELNKDGHRYWGYYSGTSSGVGLAFSEDLENWTRYTVSSPIISGVRWPTVAVQNNTIHMFYTNPPQQKIAYATSSATDGYTFTEHGVVLDSNSPHNPFLWFNPVDNDWWLLWKENIHVGTIKACHSKYIENLGSATPITLRTETNSYYGTCAAPAIFYWNNTYYLTVESHPGHWQTRAFYSGVLGVNCFDGTASECPNSPILDNGDACGFPHVEGNRLYYYWSHEFSSWNLKLRKSTETRETSPLICDEYPSNGATDVILNPVLSVNVSDLQGDTMSIIFRTNASGMWETIGVNSSVVNGTYYCDNTSVIGSYNTIYWWSVHVIDPSGSGNWNNRTYSFTTESIPVNNSPIISIKRSVIICWSDLLRRAYSQI